MPSRTATRARGGRQQTQEPSEERGLVVFDPKEKAADLVKKIEARRDQIESFLQPRSPDEYDRFVNIAVDAIVRDKNVLSADMLSLVQSIRHAAIMGLEPTSIMGEGAIVVYRDSDRGMKIAQFQPMVRGLQKLARNSGEIASIGVDVVRAKDEFDYRSGSDPVIEHRPWIKDFSGPEDPGEVIGAYAYLKLRSGELVPMFMSTAEILKRRSHSASYRNSGEKSIWGQWPEEMMKKTVLRRLLVERAPLTYKAQRALALDAEIDAVGGDPSKVEATLSRTAQRALAAHTDDDLTGSQNGSGADEKPKTDEGAADAGDGQQEAPDGATGDAGVKASAVRICGSRGPKDDEQICVLEPGHAGPHSDMAEGLQRSEWL